jgi:poly(3-hydroxybutyrate) depolymerase
VTAVSPALTSTTRPQEPTGFLNRTIEVEGVSRRYQVYVPADYTRARRWPVILFLHGSGERGADGILPGHPMADRMRAARPGERLRRRS